MTAPVTAEPVNWGQVLGPIHGLNVIASRQRSLITSEQLRWLGISQATQKRMVVRGHLLPVRYDVSVVAGAQPDEWRALQAAVLAAGPRAAASHFAAAGLHGFPEIVRGAVELTVLGRASGDLAGVTVHETHRPFPVVIAKGIRATPVARTLSDLAPHVHPSLLVRMVAFATEHRLCSLDDLRIETGRRGRRALLEAVDACGEATPDLQGLYRRLIARSPLPPPTEEFTLVLPSADFVIDFAWVPQRVGLETKGFGPHSSRHQFDRDADREGELSALGWSIVPATSRLDPAKVLGRVARLLTN